MTGLQDKPRQSARSGSPGPSVYVLAGLLLVLVIGLGGLVTRQALMARDPGAGSASSLSASWREISKPGAGPAEFQAAEALARTAFDREPLDVSAISMIATVREIAGRSKEARDLMEAAGRLSRRNDLVDLWLFRDLASRKRYTEAFARADSLLHRRFDNMPQIFPVLAGSMNDLAAIRALGAVLAKEPNWRSFFIGEVNKRARTPEVSFMLFQAINEAGGRATGEEMSSPLAKLVEERRFDEAYLYFVLQLSPKGLEKVSNVYDGDFDDLSAYGPFGWIFWGSDGHVESAAAHGRNEPALHIGFDGVSSGVRVRQLVMLPPGQYRFSGEVLTATSDTDGKVEWILTCAGASTPFAGVLSPKAVSAWRTFSATVVVAEDCPAQWLEARAVAGQTGNAAEIWYDKLKIDRIETAS